MKRLELWMVKNGIPEIRLSEYLGIHKGSVSHYLRGRRFPRPHVLKEMSEFTGGAITPAELFEDWLAAKFDPDNHSTKAYRRRFERAKRALERGERPGA